LFTFKTFYNQKNLKLKKKTPKNLILCKAKISNKSENILLHRYILKVIDSKIQVDHINGCPLDNRKINLRICNNQENNWNKKLMKNNTSGFKGVSFTSNMNMWRSSIKNDLGININLGYYFSKVEAAKKYDEKVIEYHGEFGKTNKDLGLYTEEIIEKDRIQTEELKRLHDVKEKSRTNTGVKYISFDAKTKRYRVRYKGKDLSVYKTLEEAKQVLEEYKNNIF